MKIEIWSDVVCPFCYIGKRHFETALEQFPHKSDVEVIWKSYELNPEAEKNYPGVFYDYLAEKFHTTPEQARKMNQRVIKMAEDAGLHYNMDAIKPGNSFDAHRIIHLAAKHGLQDSAEEKMFSAYFIEGKPIGDKETLKTIAKELGLDEIETSKVLSND